MKKILSLLILSSFFSFAQTEDEAMLKKIYDFSLTNSKCYSWLDDLSNKIGQRLSGSIGAEKGVLYTKTELEKLGLDRVFLQDVMVPKWVRGEKEIAYIIEGKSKIEAPVCALGGSVATVKNGLTAEIIEVKSIDELKTLGEEKVKGKIVFFNRPMEPTNIEAFTSYGRCVDQRFYGAMEASKLGAV